MGGEEVGPFSIVTIWNLIFVSIGVRGEHDNHGTCY